MSPRALIARALQKPTVFLFNSAYRPLYRTNVLNTLFLPHGMMNDYRYSISGPVRHVSNDDRAVLLRSGRRANAVVIFVDRFGVGGYSYYPLRGGVVLDVFEEASRLFIRVKLTDYVAASDRARFEKELRELLPELPKLTGGDPEKKDDGNYAMLVRGASSKNLLSLLERGDSTWTETTKLLAGVRAFQDPTVFARLAVSGADDKRKLRAVLQGHTTGVPLQKGSTGRVRFTYRFPASGAEVHKIKIDATEGLYCAAEDVAIDSTSNSVDLTVEARRYQEEQRGELRFYPPEKLELSNRPLVFHLREVRFFGLQVLVGVILFALTSVVIGVSAPPGETLGLSYFLNYGVGLKFLASVVQACVLLWLFRLFGRKLL